MTDDFHILMFQTKLYVVLQGLPPVGGQVDDGVINAIGPTYKLQLTLTCAEDDKQSECQKKKKKKVVLRPQNVCLSGGNTVPSGNVCKQKRKSAMLC